MNFIMVMIAKIQVMKLNTEKILELAHFIESLDDSRFNLDYYASQFYTDYYKDVIDGSSFTIGHNIDINVCQTAGCIAGWTLALENGGSYNVGFVKNHIYADSMAIEAGYHLGIPLSYAKQLFYTYEKGSIWRRYLGRYYHLLDEQSKDFIFRKYDDVNSDNALEQYSYFANEHIDMDEIRISNKCAAYVLRMLACGEFQFMNFDHFQTNKAEVN